MRLRVDDLVDKMMIVAIMPAWLTSVAWFGGLVSLCAVHAILEKVALVTLGRIPPRKSRAR